MKGLLFILQYLDQAKFGISGTKGWGRARCAPCSNVLIFISLVSLAEACSHEARLVCMVTTVNGCLNVFFFLQRPKTKETVHMATVSVFKECKEVK